MRFRCACSRRIKRKKSYACGDACRTMGGIIVRLRSYSHPSYFKQFSRMKGSLFARHVLYQNVARWLAAENPSRVLFLMSTIFYSEKRRGPNRFNGICASVSCHLCAIIKTNAKNHFYAFLTKNLSCFLACSHKYYLKKTGNQLSFQIGSYLLTRCFGAGASNHRRHQAESFSSFKISHASSPFLRHRAFALAVGTFSRLDILSWHHTRRPLNPFLQYCLSCETPPLLHADKLLQRPSSPRSFPASNRLPFKPFPSDHSPPHPQTFIQSCNRVINQSPVCHHFVISLSSVCQTLMQVLTSLFNCNWL